MLVLNAAPGRFAFFCSFSSLATTYFLCTTQRLKDFLCFYSETLLAARSLAKSGYTTVHAQLSCIMYIIYIICMYIMCTRVRVHRNIRNVLD